MSGNRETRLSDHTTFEQMVLPHLDAAYNLARWLARDTHDAEDVVQDACIRALKYAGSLHGNDARAWFLTIVRNAFYDWLGRNRPVEIVHEDDEKIAARIDPSSPNPEHEALRRAEMHSLSDAIEALPLQYREVLVLRELEEMSYKEIARVADIPIGTVMSRLARARGLLQRSPVLQEFGGEAIGSER